MWRNVDGKVDSPSRHMVYGAQYKKVNSDTGGRG